jgi:hypothetical protein
MKTLLLLLKLLLLLVLLKKVCRLVSGYVFVSLHGQVFTYIYLFFPRYANYNSDGLPVHDSSGNELGRREKEAMMKEQQKLKSRWEAEEEKLFEDMGAVARLYNQTTTMIREDKQVRKKQLGGVR